MAIQLTKDANFHQEIARKALEDIHKIVYEFENTYTKEEMKAFADMDDDDFIAQLREMWEK